MTDVQLRTFQEFIKRFFSLPVRPAICGCVTASTLQNEVCGELIRRGVLVLGQGPQPIDTFAVDQVRTAWTHGQTVAVLLTEADVAAAWPLLKVVLASGVDGRLILVCAAPVYNKLGEVLLSVCRLDD